MERTQPHQTEANFSIDEYGAKTAEKEECEEQLLTEYATLLGFYLASAAVLTGIALQQNRLPRKFGLLDLALLGMATYKLSRIVAKDRITGILRAPFVSYIRSSGAGEVEEEPRGRGFQRGIGHLISCPYCMAALVRHSSEFRSAFRTACDAVLRWDFGKRNRLGLSPPRVRQNERGVIIESHASQKQMIMPLRPAIEQTHQFASRDRMNP